MLSIGKNLSALLFFAALLLGGCGGGGATSTGGSGLTAQTITFANPGTQMVGTPLILSATASSGLAVTFASATTSVCTVSGTTATFVAAGTCTIDANQAGNSIYAAAPQVADSFTVNAASGQTTTVYIVGFASLATGGTTAEEWQLTSGSSTAVASALPLPSGATGGSEATGIAVSGSDVYVAGYAYDNDAPETGTAAYWVNGTLETLPLPSGTTGAVTNGIAVSGSDVYVAGYGYEDDALETEIAAYWVNGAATTLPLPSGTTSAQATGIAVSGGNVYVVGWGYDSATQTYTAAYWVNGTLETLPLPSGTTGAYATGIAVSTQ